MIYFILFVWFLCGVVVNSYLLAKVKNENLTIDAHGFIAFMIIFAISPLILIGVICNFVIWKLSDVSGGI